MEARLQQVIDGQEALQQRCSHLKNLSEQGSSGEEAIRHRFLSCFKRDILRTPSEQDYTHIRKGTAIAHHGNCSRDPDLYELGGRTDAYAFEKLYGFLPSAIRNEISRKFFLTHNEARNANS